MATLEVFVHTESNKIPLVAIRAYFSDDLLDDLLIETVDTQNLPQKWQEVGAYPQLQQIGKQWLQANQAPILKVPSSIVPVEFNYLLNPCHPNLKLTLDPPMAFKFDRRMWKSFAQDSKNK